MNQTVWGFNASFTFPTGPWAGRLVFLDIDEANSVRAQYQAGGYTVSEITSEIRYVDPITGAIGGTPAATVPVATSTTAPTGTAPSQPPTAGTSVPGTMYRFIVQSGPNTFDTGANLPGCAQSSPTACDPQQKGSLYDAVQYAARRGEVPYLAATVDEVWGIISGTIQPNPARIINPLSVSAPGPGMALAAATDNTLLYVGAGLLAAFLLFS